MTACATGVLAFAPPLADPRCTAFASLVVPIAGSAADKPGMTRLRVRTRPIDDGFGRDPLAGDTDVLRLYCYPAG